MARSAVTGRSAIVPEPTGLRHAICEPDARKGDRMKTTLIALAVVAAFAAPHASADDKAKKNATASGRSLSAPLFERLDRNKDGFVTRDEAKDATELQGRFTELDKNNDGKLSPAEMGALDAERSAAGGSKARK